MANRKAAISRVLAATTTGKLLAGTLEVAIAGTEADLCLLGDVPDDFWQALEASSERFARLGYSVLSALTDALRYVRIARSSGRAVVPSACRRSCA
jgi:hypothetical protein